MILLDTQTALNLLPLLPLLAGLARLAYGGGN